MIDPVLGGFAAIVLACGLSLAALIWAIAQLPKDN
jgi:hypothetical protein